MTDQFEDRLERLLAHKADLARDGDTLTRTTTARGRRLRSRRRISAGVAGIAGTAALAVGAPLAFGAFTGPGDAASTIQPTDTEPSKPRKVVIGSLDELSPGRAPRIPWSTAGTIRDGGRTIPIAGETKALLFKPVEGGYIAMTGSGAAARVRLYDKDGDLVREVARGMPAVSGDGRSIAYRDGDDLVSMRVGNGATERIRIPGAEPSGFFGSTVVFIDTASSPHRTGFWNTRTDAISYAKDRAAINTHDKSGLMTGRSPKDGNDRCTGVFRRADAEPLWSTCVHEALWFSGNGRYVAGGANIQAPGDDTGFIAWNTRTGDPTLQIVTAKTQSYYNIGFEPDGSALVILLDPAKERAAIARVTPNGKAELATAVTTKDTPLLPFQDFGM